MVIVEQHGGQTLLSVRWQSDLLPRQNAGARRRKSNPRQMSSSIIAAAPVYLQDERPREVESVAGMNNYVRRTDMPQPSGEKK